MESHGLDGMGEESLVYKSRVTGADGGGVTHLTGGRNCIYLSDVFCMLIFILASLKVSDLRDSKAGAPFMTYS